MQAIQTILHPTDFCERCDDAFQLACARATEQEARLVVLHVAPPPVYGMLRILVHDYEELWNRLQRLRAPEEVVRLEHLLSCGDPTQEILRAARALRCDLIVMGTHGRTRLGRLLKSSVAQGVIRAAPCAVLTTPTVPPTWTQASARQVAATVP